MVGQIQSWVCTAIGVAHEWQTLIASAVALFAAWLALKAIKKQIDLQQAQIKEDRQRYLDTQQSKGWAARADMPDALSALCNYAADCFEYVADEHHEVSLPTPPAGAIRVLKNGIEYVDPQSAHQLFEVVVHYQVHNSRLRDLDHLERDPFEHTDRLFDAVYLRALVDRLFEYARNQVDVIPDREMNHADMFSALRNCVGLEDYVGNEAMYADINARIEQSYPNQ